MPETRGDVQYIGVGKPTFFERHTPRAHTEAIMQKYFWATDRLQGKPKEIAQKLEPWARRAAVIGGWEKTGLELYLAGQAIGLAAFLAGRQVKTVAQIFSRLGRRDTMTETVVETFTPPPPPEPLRDLGERPAHISPRRFAAMRSVSPPVLGRIPEKPKRLSPAVRPASIADAVIDLRDRLNIRDIQKVAGTNARAFGEYLRDQQPNISDNQRRHLQRAFAKLLAESLSQNHSASSIKVTNLEKPFRQALDETKSRGDRTPEVVFALNLLQSFLKSQNVPKPVI